MPSSSPSRQEFLIRFGCAFPFFSFLAFLLSVRLVDDWGVIPVAVGAFLVVVGVSIFVALKGDGAWEFLLRR